MEIVCTTGPGSAAAQAREASASADVIFACGGDGTVHEVLQGLVSEKAEPACTLGVIPLGSANALARHLQLSLDPCNGSSAAGAWQSVHYFLGQDRLRFRHSVFCRDGGAGPDGALVYSLLAQHKSQLGRLAYYLRAARLFATRRFRSFEVEFTPAGSGPPVTTQSSKCDGGARRRILAGFLTVSRARRLPFTTPFCVFISFVRPRCFRCRMWFVSGWLGLNS